MRCAAASECASLWVPFVGGGERYRLHSVVSHSAYAGSKEEIQNKINQMRIEIIFRGDEFEIEILNEMENGFSRLLFVCTLQYYPTNIIDYIDEFHYAFCFWFFCFVLVPMGLLIRFNQ